MTEQQPPKRSNIAGKVIALGVIPALVIAMGAIGYHHATINKIRHEPGTRTGDDLYQLYCLRCHQADLRGNPAKEYPSLVAREFQLEEFSTVVREGRNKMPKFPFVDEDMRRLFEHVRSKR
jgi:mono/diheme cytochrome c family protein